MSVGAINPERASATGRQIPLPILFACATAALIAMQVELVLAKSINWDEFFHFSQIHAAYRGEHVQWLQTPYVRLFGWVPALPGSAIDQIILIRMMIMPFALVTCWAVFDISRRFADRISAMLATLAFATAGNVYLHSFALRADMIAACLLSLSAWVLVTRARTLWWAIVSLALVIAAMLATIKSVLWAPALLGLALFRWQSRWKPGQAMAMAVAVTVSTMLIWLFLPDPISRSIGGLAASSWERMFSAGLFPQGAQFLKQIMTGPIFAAFAVIGLARAGKGGTTMPFWLAMLLAAPLASIAVYRNSYPYFFPFILPPLAIVAALGAQALLKRFSPAVMLGGIFAMACVLSLTEERDVIDRQRKVHAGIDEIFPGPVRYVDDVAFKPDYPRAVAQFASGWALEGYRRKGSPVYGQAIEQEATPMLFRQGYALETINPDRDDAEALLVEDAATLSRNYLQHWGRVFVLGHRIEASRKTQQIRIIAAGPYTVEGNAVVIDGKRHATGQVIELEKGTMSVAPIEGSAATLRWGARLVRPASPFPDGPLFTDY